MLNRQHNLQLFVPCALILNLLSASPMTLMLPFCEENRGAILGFISAASTDGTALSAVLYGALGDAFELYLVFAAGSALSLLPMLYMCFHPRTKAFVVSH